MTSPFSVVSEAALADALPSSQVLTVSQLTMAIKSLLEMKFRLVLLEGEISNFKLQSSGHLYFTLKDKDAQISAVMFRMDAMHLLRPPRDGDKVFVSGELSVYAPRGNYQLIIRQLRFSGTGELLLKLEQLKQQLNARGWFASERKRPLPFLPTRIGVVTSPTGAVIQDIIHVLTRRYPGFQLILNPVKVQGEGAKEEITKAILHFSQYDLADVLIVGRGGGSLEDLWAFNEECVAQAILMSQIPVISAVGHETDFTIADFVADKRAPTPSAAAEMVLPTKESLVAHLEQMRRRLQQTLWLILQKNQHQLKRFSQHPFLLCPHKLLEVHNQKLDLLAESLTESFQRNLQQRRQALYMLEQRLVHASPFQRLAMARQFLGQKRSTLDLLMRKALHHRQELIARSNYASRINTAFKKKIDQEQNRLLSLKGRLDVLNPNNLLKKGYAIIFSENNSSAIVGVSQLHPEQPIRIRFSDGQANAHITQIISSEGSHD